MIKIDRYDAQKLLEAKELIKGVADYNYTSETNKLFRKFQTILSKLDNILNNELEPELQEEYRLLGRV